MKCLQSLFLILYYYLPFALYAHCSSSKKNQENEESNHDSRCRKSGLRKKTDESEFSSGDHSVEHALLQMTVKSAGVLLHLAGYQNVSPYSDTTWILNNN